MWYYVLNKRFVEVDMGKYTGILLCSDFDGTLFNGEYIPEENIKAISISEKMGDFLPLQADEISNSSVRYLRVIALACRSSTLTVR